MWLLHCLTLRRRKMELGTPTKGSERILSGFRRCRVGLYEFFDSRWLPRVPCFRDSEREGTGKPLVLCHSAEVIQCARTPTAVNVLCGFAIASLTTERQLILLASVVPQLCCLLYDTTALRVRIPDMTQRRPFLLANTFDSRSSESVCQCCRNYTMNNS
jgi:hypothetical protein